MPIDSDSVKSKLLHMNNLSEEDSFNGSAAADEYDYNGDGDVALIRQRHPPSPKRSGID